MSNCDCNYISIKNGIIHSVHCSKSEMQKTITRYGFAEQGVKELVFENQLREEMYQVKLTKAQSLLDEAVEIVNTLYECESSTTLKSNCWQRAENFLQKYEGQKGE